MRFVAEKSALERVCGFVCPVASNKLNIPIMACVKIEVGERVKITGSNFDIEVSGTFDAQITRKGLTCVEAAILHNLTRSAPKGAQIEIELKNEQIIFRCGRSIAKLSTLPAEDFPLRAKPESFSASFPISGEELVALFGRTDFAVLSEQTRYYLCGTNLFSRGDHLIVEATDGNVMARVITDAPDGCKIEAPIIIPTVGVAAIKRAVDLTELPVQLSIGTNAALAVAGDFSISTKLIDGTFPDIDRIIPQPKPKLIEIDREAFVAVLSNLARLVDGDKDRARSCILTFDNNSVEITGKLASGDFRDEIECRYQGEPIRVCLDINYLLDAISSIPANDITLSGASFDPWLIRASGDVGGSLVVLSPRRG